MKFTVDQWNRVCRVILYKCIQYLTKWNLLLEAYKTKFTNAWSRKVYIAKTDNIVNKYNKRYHSTIKIKLADLKSSTFIDSGIEDNGKDPNLRMVTT